MATQRLALRRPVHSLREEHEQRICKDNFQKPKLKVSGQTTIVRSRASHDAY